MRPVSATDVVGSIPACAGEPAPAPIGAGTREVYPRVCGGTLITIGLFTVVGGLSSRVRGDHLRA